MTRMLRFIFITVVAVSGLLAFGLGLIGLFAMLESDLDNPALIMLFGLSVTLCSLIILVWLVAKLLRLTNKIIPNRGE